MKYNKILIIRTDRIGDVILSTPAIQAAREANTSSHIAFMTRPYTKDIVLGNPYLDEVIVYDKDGAHRSIIATIKFALSLRSKKFDLALILHSTNRTNLIAFLAGIPKRIGYQRKCRWFLTDRLPYLKSQGLKHEMEYTLDILKAAGMSFNEEKLKPFIPVSKIDEDFAAIFCQENKINEGDLLIGIHPSASCLSRRWPAQRFAQVADKLIESLGCKIIVLGAGDDLKLANSVKNNMKHEAVVVKDFTIPQVAAILKLCKVFISTDTGPAHIARTMDVPCVTIFGRKQPGLSPVRWRPVGKLDKEVIFLHKDVGCIGCLAHNCKKNFACLEAVTVDEVLDAAKRLL